MSAENKKSEVEVENVAAADEKAEAKELKGVKRPADVSINSYISVNLNCLSVQ